MSSQGNGDHLERLTQEAVEHQRLIRKYAAWIAFFVLLAGALSLSAVLIRLLGSVTTVSTG